MLEIGLEFWRFCPGRKMDSRGEIHWVCHALVSASSVKCGVGRWFGPRRTAQNHPHRHLSTPLHRCGRAPPNWQLVATRTDRGQLRNFADKVTPCGFSGVRRIFFAMKVSPDVVAIPE